LDVKTLCLGVLSQGDKTGYEIKKCFEECFKHFFIAGFGSIYPALAELTKRELVRVRDVEQNGRPDKKVYSLTGAGWQALRDELAAAEPRHKVRSEFLVLMYFGHLLPPERLIHVLDSMISQWESLLWDEIAQVERNHAEAGAEPLTPGMRFAVGYGHAVLTAALAYCRRHRDQLLRELADNMPDAADARAAGD